MSTEAVKKVKWDAHRALDPFLYAAGFEKVALDTVLDKIGVSWEALAWCAANPEAAKGLAEGAMVATAVKVRPGQCPVCLVVYEIAARNGEPAHASWCSQLVANPVPSDEAQGETT